MKSPVDMLKRDLLVVLICSLGLLTTSCGSSTGPSNNGGNGGNGNQPPPEPTFTNVLTIFENSCGGSSCHIGNRQSGVRLDSYDNVINSEGVQYGGLIVIPGEPENSPIIDKIASQNPEFGVRMPKGGPPLSEEQIALIRDWINEGAQNN